MEQRHILSPGPGGLSLGRDEIARRLDTGYSPHGRTDPAVAEALGGWPPPGKMKFKADPTPASVLVPLIERDGGHTVLLTQRTAHLAHHPGQISFPGGRLEDADHGDPVECALRETEEEVGLSRERVVVLGRLDDYFTGTGFRVTPVVAAVTPPFELALDAFEVAEVFEVPLDFLMDNANHVLHTREVEGRLRPFWAMTWQDRHIWGATAGMLVNLSDVLKSP
jgi:8-oxo-dGTP pyrophosphatase MutT (NUDIX family)